MKMLKETVSILAILGIAIIVSIPLALAETTSVRIPSGTSVPGCEKTNECFLPHEVSIEISDEVIWSNEDSAAHTVTAGSASDGPSGVFDSSLFMSGTTFSHKFDVEGDFPYFCMVHPWMNGIVHVGTGSTESNSPKPELISNPEEDSRVVVTLNHKISGGKITNMIADGNSNSVIIELDSTEAGQVAITLPREIIDSKAGSNDDDFFVVVDNEESSFEETKTTTARTLTIDFPAGTEKIEIIGTFAIPEFGSIAVLIFSVAILSIIGLSARSKLNIQRNF